ncbi:MAG: GerW family sporulation protein [Candidatus Zixiibacteriota bacterium]
MANNVVELLQGIVGELKDIARTESIVGDPITIGDRTLVPVIRISIGFGAGGGEGSDNQNRGGFGGGGGGGARIDPAAFIVIEPDGISLLPARPGTIDALVDAVPAVIGKIGKLAKNLASKKPKKDGDPETPESETTDS